jgi:hypothetical protein
LAEEDSLGLLVGAEEPLDGEPEHSGSWLLILHGELKNGVVDGAKHPGADATVSLIQLGSSGRGAIVPSMCDRRPNLPHMDLKKDDHLV